MLRFSDQKSRLLAMPLLALALLSAGCGGKKEETHNDEVQKATQGKSAIEDKKEITKSSSFNQFFPKQSDTPGYDLIAKQEKDGIALWSAKKSGKEVATLSITDTKANPSGVEKYKTATAKLSDYPEITEGNNGTAILVSDRYQVKVRTLPPAKMTNEEREEWLKKFDLAGLSALK